jgi:HSP20 family protein
MNNLLLTRNRNELKTDKRNLGNYGGWSSLMDELFHDDLNVVRDGVFKQNINKPKVNIIESDEAYVMHMSVPGFEKSDFVIGLENEELSVSAEVKSEEGQEELNFTRKEFTHGSFKRTFVLPDTIEDSAIDANYTNGILAIRIPKKEEAKPKPARTIEIS